MGGRGTGPWVPWLVYLSRKYLTVLLLVLLFVTAVRSTKQSVFNWLLRSYPVALVGIVEADMHTWTYITHGTLRQQ